MISIQQGLLAEGVRVSMSRLCRWFEQGHNPHIGRALARRMRAMQNGNPRKAARLSAPYVPSS